MGNFGGREAQNNFSREPQLSEREINNNIANLIQMGGGRKKSEYKYKKYEKELKKYLESQGNQSNQVGGNASDTFNNFINNKHGDFSTINVQFENNQYGGEGQNFGEYNFSSTSPIGSFRTKPST